MSTLGQRLRKARERKGWSQTFVCEKLKISNSRLSGYERDYREPDADMISTFADIYDVSSDWILGRTDDPSPANNPTVTVAGQEIELTPEQYKVFQEMMKHPKFMPMFHDLATDTEKKVKQLIDTWEFVRKQIEQEHDDEEFGEGFGELDD